MGVPQSWLLDPIYRAACTHDDNGLTLVTADRLQLPDSPIHLILPDLFSALD